VVLDVETVLDDMGSRGGGDSEDPQPPHRS
jgi:hypothetical protein